LHFYPKGSKLLRTSPGSSVCCCIIWFIYLFLLTQLAMCGLKQKPLLYHFDKSSSCTTTASQCQDYPMYCGLRLAFISVCQDISTVMDHNSLGHKEGELWNGTEIRLSVEESITSQNYLPQWSPARHADWYQIIQFAWLCRSYRWL